MMLSVFLGSGAQLFCMSSTTVIFALLGFLSPSNRGALMTSIVVAYVLFGWVAGFVSARFYKMWGGENWKRNVMLTGLVVPG
jgi:transmembrane 9 superfamily protein 2/4